MNSFIKRRVLSGSRWVEFPRWCVRGSSPTPRVVPGPHGAGSVGRPSIWNRPLAGRVSRAARRGARPSEIIHEPERSGKDSGVNAHRELLTGAKRSGIDDHLASVGPDMVLDEIAHVSFAGSLWKKDLLRAKPPMNTTEGRILPVLATPIAAFRYAPEWGGVLAFNEFGFGTVVLKPAPWGVVPKGEWTDHEHRLTAEWLQGQGIIVSVEVAGQA